MIGRRGRSGGSGRRALLVMASAAVGCASAPSRFPSAEALRNLTAARGVADLPGTPVVNVAEWKLSGPFPAGIDGLARPPKSPAEQALAATGSPLTESALCTAREIGLFRAAQAGDPTETLVRFIAARCGLPSPSLTYACYPGAALDATAPGRVVDPAVPALDGDLPVAPPLAGVWQGENKGLPLTCTVTAPRRLASVDALMTPDQAGRVIIRGELPPPAGDPRKMVVALSGLVNRGHTGVGHCLFQAGVPLPRFVAACDVEPSDTPTWIELVALPRGQVLGPVVLRMLVSPAGAPSDLFRAPAPAPTAAACPSVDDGTGGLLACLNRARTDAGLRPLQLAPAQSQSFSRLTPVLFSRATGNVAAERRAQAVAGLAAGWDIAQPRRYGQVVQAHVDGADAASAAADLTNTRRLAALFERPTGRAALTDPAAELVAMTEPADAQRRSADVAVAVYAVMRAASADENVREVQEILRDLDGARAGLGLAPAAPFVADIGDTMLQARSVTAGRRRPAQAIWNAMRYAASALHWEHVHGWQREAQELHHLAFPRPLLELPQPEVAVGVARVRPDNEPWTRYLIFFIAPHGGREPMEPDDDVGYTVDPPPIDPRRAGF